MFLSITLEVWLNWYKVFLNSKEQPRPFEALSREYQAKRNPTFLVLIFTCPVILQKLPNLCLSLYIDSYDNVHVFLHRDVIQYIIGDVNVLANTVRISRLFLPNHDFGICLNFIDSLLTTLEKFPTIHVYEVSKECPFSLPKIIFSKPAGTVQALGAY